MSIYHLLMNTISSARIYWILKGAGAQKTPGCACWRQLLGCVLSICTGGIETKNTMMRSKKSVAVRVLATSFLPFGNLVIASVWVLRGKEWLIGVGDHPSQLLDGIVCFDKVKKQPMIYFRGLQGTDQRQGCNGQTDEEGESVSRISTQSILLHLSQISEEEWHC